MLWLKKPAFSHRRRRNGPTTLGGGCAPRSANSCGRTPRAGVLSAWLNGPERLRRQAILCPKQHRVLDGERHSPLPPPLSSSLFLVPLLSLSLPPSSHSLSLSLPALPLSRSGSRSPSHSPSPSPPFGEALRVRSKFTDAEQARPELHRQQWLLIPFYSHSYKAPPSCKAPPSAT